MAVAQHRVAVADPEHLLQPVGDEDDRQAFGLQRAHDADEIRDLGLAQSRGRLVHDDEPRLHRQRAGDLDQLLLGDRKVAHLRHRIALEADALGDRLRLLGHAPPAHEQPRARLAADEHVLGDRHVGSEGEFLVDRDDASALGVVGRRKSDRLPEQLDLAGIGALRAGQDLQQRRLAGAVLAEQRVDLAGPTSRWTSSSASTPGKRLLTPVILRIGLSDVAGADESAAGALAIQERSLIRGRDARGKWRAARARHETSR